MGRRQRFVCRCPCLDVNPVFGMQIGISGRSLECKSRRLKKGKAPEMLGIGSSGSENAGDPPKCQLASVI